MKLLERYIFSEIILPFLFSLIAFISIFLGSSVIPFISKAIKNGLSASDIGILIIYKVPPVVSIVLPMAVLLGVILGTSRLNNDNELIALRSMGLSFYRILLPILVFGLSISVFNFFLNEVVVPKAAYNSYIYEKKLKQTEKNIKRHVNVTEYFSGGKPKRILNVQQVDGYQLKGITVAEYDEKSLVRLIRARLGEWNKSGFWILRDGAMHSFNSEDMGQLLHMTFKEEKININLNLDKLKDYRRTSEEMSIIELKELIEFKNKTGEDVTRDSVDYHLKIALPFVSVLFSILGACISVRSLRNNSRGGFGISLGVIISYYILYSLSLAFVYSINIPPILIAWFPNFVVGCITFWLLRRVAYQS